MTDPALPPDTSPDKTETVPDAPAMDDPVCIITSPLILAGLAAVCTDTPPLGPEALTPLDISTSPPDPSNERPPSNITPPPVDIPSIPIPPESDSKG
jgi:hypothetical protein